MTMEKDIMNNNDNIENIDAEINAAENGETIEAAGEGAGVAESAANDAQGAIRAGGAAGEAENAGLTQDEIAEAMAKELGSASNAVSADGGSSTAEAAAAADAAGVNGELNMNAPGQEEAFIEEALPSELTETQAKSIIESVLFASPHPVSYQTLKTLFSHTNIDAEKLWDVLNHLQTDYAGGERGIVLEEVAGGYQLRTKLDNSGWLKKMVKARPFRLSGPALEVLSLIAYKQPVIKAEVDEIRGVESGHLIRALMEKHLVRFAGKSELPGKPMLYATTKNFLELFGLRNIRELPTLSEIDKLIPEGIGLDEDMQEKETLGSLADKIAIDPGKSYSDSENELLSITETLTEIATTTDFFEQEKIRERERRDAERAQDIKERIIVGEIIPEVDNKWLARYEAKLAAQAAAAAAAAATAVTTPGTATITTSENDLAVVIAAGTDLAAEAVATEETTAVAVAKVATDSEEFETVEVEIEMIDDAEQGKIEEMLNAASASNADDAAGAGSASTTAEGEALFNADATGAAELLAAETEMAMAEAATRQASKKKKINAAPDDDVDAKKRVSAATLAAEAHLAAFMDDDENGGLDN